MSQSEITVIKNNLLELLGAERLAIYFGHLRSWLSRGCSRQDFESNVRQLMPSHSGLTLHNQFLLSLINRCQFLSTHARLPATESPAADQIDEPVAKRPRHVDSPSNALIAQRVRPWSNMPADFQMVFSVDDRLLPNVECIGRVYAHLLNEHVDDVTENALEMLFLAVDQLLKNIITELVCWRKTYRFEGRLRCQFGAGHRVATLNNAATRCHDDLDSFAKTDQNAPAAGVAMLNLWDLWQCLRCNPQVICHGATLNTCLARISNRFSHESHEELFIQENAGL